MCSCGTQVQDLTPAQLALFAQLGKPAMREQGFIFAGDTAQTIARGVGFRFQDIRWVGQFAVLGRRAQMLNFVQLHYAAWNQDD